MTTLPSPAIPAVVFDPLAVRRDFPILQTRMNGRPLVYLDNAATTQKPQAVIDAITHYYTHDNANIHRGVYALSQRATSAYEQARKKVARFINAPDAACCIFTRGTTEGINLVASSWARTQLRQGDEILIGEMEHHSNIVPWQLAAEATGATIRVIPMDEQGELRLEALDDLVSPRTKLVAIQQVSNALGTIQPVEQIVARAKAVGARVLLDGAQWVAHQPTDVEALGCDFYVFSGHKLFGPTGIGVLWAKRELLEAMPPYQGGGDMIETVTFDRSTWAPLPNKFEAGTPDIAGAIGLGAAIDYVTKVGIERYAAYEDELLHYATEQIDAIEGIRIIGRAKRKAGVISFVIETPSISPLDIGLALDRDGIAVRTGHHCCMPIMTRLGIAATTRASFAMYNMREDVDALVKSLRKLVDEKRSMLREKGAVAPSVPAEALPFAAATARSPDEAADELAEDFELFEERDAKTEYVLDLAKEVPHTFETLKNLTARVPGCMSEVYLIGRGAPQMPEKFEFVADSNAEIVRGLIAILGRLYSGQDAKQVLAFDVEGFFRRIGLEQFISTQRRNGLAGMIARIRALAGAVAKD
jgi:cysteine desulfurase / selenocysteine lyase